MDLSKYFESLMAADPRFEMPIKTDFGLVCFCIRDSEERTKGLIAAVKERTDIFMDGC